MHNSAHFRVQQGLRRPENGKGVSTGLHHRGPCVADPTAMRKFQGTVDHSLLLIEF